MRSVMTFHVPGVLLAVLPLVACGSSAPTFPVAYSAEQLNAASQRPLARDSFGGPPAREEAAPAPIEEPPAPPPAPAALRVIHASPDRAAASVSVYLDGSEVAAMQGVAYRAIVGAVQVAPGAHPVSVRSTNAAGTVLLTAETPALTEGGRFTAIVHGLGAGAPRLALAASQDSTEAPDAGKARVRFFHALVGLGAVDVCTVATPGHPAAAVFANVAFGAFGAYADVPAGAPIALQVRAQNARPCTGLVRGTARVTPADRGIVTAVAIGRVVGAPAAPRQLLVCDDARTDGAPSCATVAVQ